MSTGTGAGDDEDDETISLISHAHAYMNSFLFFFQGFTLMVRDIEDDGDEDNDACRFSLPFQ